MTGAQRTFRRQKLRMMMGRILPAHGLWIPFRNTAPKVRVIDPKSIAAEPGDYTVKVTSADSREIVMEVQ